MATAQPNDPGDPGDPREPGPNAARYAPRRILVRLRTSADNDDSPFAVGDESEDWRAAPEPDSVRAIAEDLVAQATGGRVLHRFWFVPGLQVWEVERGTEVERALAASGVPWVRYAQVDHVGRLAASFPNDPAYVDGYQWGLNRICIAAAYSKIAKSTDYPIAIADSGVDYLHPQLGPSILVNALDPLPPDGIDNDGNGYIDDYWGANVSLLGLTCVQAQTCDQTCEGDPSDLLSHGKHVAAVSGALAHDCRSIAGTAGLCSLIPVKIHTDTVPTDCSSLIFGVTDTAILLGFQYATDRGAKIVNCSWTAEDSDALSDAFKGLQDHDIVAVLAAGNHCCNIDGPGCEGSYPARYTLDNMIVVGASTSTDARWQVPPPHGLLECGSNYGAVSVDLFAPGESIRSLSSGDSNTSCTATVSGYYATGTSFAAPHVAGVAALTWAAHPTFKAADVVNRLRSTARPVPALSGLCVSGGVLDAASAVGVAPCVP